MDWFTTDRELLLALFQRAVEAAMPERAIVANLPPPPRGRTVVVGAGKAASQMALALERHWTGPLSGVVVTPYKHAVACKQIKVLEASHPVPDEAGLRAAEQLMQAVSGLTSDDLVVALISGGGSSLLPAPAPGLTLADEQALNTALLASGAPIGVMNVIRNQVSTIKGGRLARQCWPAPVVTLIVSDIPGDDAALVASGPTIPIVGDRQTARQLVDSYGTALPPALRALLDSEDNLPPAPDDAVFARNRHHIIASAAQSLEAAAQLAREVGLEPVILSDSIEGDARAIGGMHAAMIREIVGQDRPFRRPALILSGGETSVAARGNGCGGRNSEFAMALAAGIEGLPDVTALAADTDGVDGNSGAAGAVVTGSTMQRLRAAWIDPRALLARNDTASGFASLGDLIHTGPTGTNVNDFRAVLVR